jgi:hypothetical protein
MFQPHVRDVNDNTKQFHRSFICSITSRDRKPKSVHRLIKREVCRHTRTKTLCNTRWSPVSVHANETVCFGVLDRSTTQRSQIHFVSQVFADISFLHTLDRPFCNVFIVRLKLYIFERRLTNYNGGLPLR